MEIGLGVMGYGMVVNLRSKMSRDWTVYVCDTNAEIIERYLAEVNDQGPVEVVQTGAEAARCAVSGLAKCQC